MSEPSPLKSLAVALGAVFAGSLASTASAAENPFAQTELTHGYQTTQMAEGACGNMPGMTGGAGNTGKACDLKVMDSNGDGKVTKEEFTAHHATLFEAADTNRDGVLDNAEHIKMMDTMRGGKAPMEGKCGAGMMGK